jgi:hypothetical protein
MRLKRLDCRIKLAFMCIECPNCGVLPSGLLFGRQSRMDELARLRRDGKKSNGPLSGWQA